MGYTGDPYDDQGTGNLEQDVVSGNRTDAPDEVADFLQDRA